MGKVRDLSSEQYARYLSKSGDASTNWGWGILSRHGLAVAISLNLTALEVKKGWWTCQLAVHLTTHTMHKLQ